MYRVADAGAAQQLFEELQNSITDDELYIATETPGTDYASINLVTHGAPPFARQVIITAVSGTADLQQFTLPADAPVVLVQIIHRDV